MNKVSAAILFVGCLILTGNAQEIAVHGNVTSSTTTAIQGARVTLKNYPDMVTYTDESGAFTLSSSSPVISPKILSPVSQLPLLRNDQINFVVTKTIEHASIDQFNLQGVLLFSQKLKNIIPGQYHVPLQIKSQGMYLIRLKLGEETYSMRVLNGSGTMSNAAEKTGVSLLKSGKTASAVDTLIVTAENWKHALIDLPDYSQEIEVTLIESNPWKPLGSLTYEKGMVKIVAKGYDFEMGQSQPISADYELIYTEQPVHTVKISHDFWMDTTEITQKMYDSLMLKVYPEYLVSNSRSDIYGVGDNLPAYLMNWDDAALFCNARSKDDGLDTVYQFSEINGTPGELCILLDVAWDLNKNGYRLPTEAEWEYACRGGTATDYYWGKNFDDYPKNSTDSTAIGTCAIWRDNAYDLGLGVTGYGVHAVATTLPNSYGLYDMAGNVSEHVNDYESFSYDYGMITDPAGPQTGDIHLIRGGNWGNDAVQLRSSNRNFSAANYPFFFCGFRTVKQIVE